ncbi:MAG TPA: cytochrome-c oxidase [Planococcus sp. (in: firmicutes)]|nr:cytochrome-c oxidase [Planococcus sp. (in: firmicutes)]
MKRVYFCSGHAKVNTKGTECKMGKAFIKVASVYLLLGISFGVYMGITENFDYGHTHAHVNLLGWATMGVCGLIYCVFPRAGNSKLGKTHFWLYNIGTPFLLVGMFLFAIEMDGPALLLAIIGGAIVLAGTLVFVVNVFSNVKESTLSKVRE